MPRVPPGGGRNCFEFCHWRVNRNCIDQPNPRSNWVVSINKTEFSPSVRLENATIYRGKFYGHNSSTGPRKDGPRSRKLSEKIIIQLDFRGNEAPLLPTKRQYDPKINYVYRAWHTHAPKRIRSIYFCTSLRTIVAVLFG